MTEVAAPATEVAAPSSAPSPTTKLIGHPRHPRAGGGLARTVRLLSRKHELPFQPRRWDLTRPHLKLPSLRMKQPAVYILASGRNGTLYTGVTANLARRTSQHKLHRIPGFSRTHGVDLLVWLEAHPTMESAIRREKAIKRWNRKWKLALIEKGNPCWEDLFSSIC